MALRRRGAGFASFPDGKYLAVLLDHTFTLYGLS